MDGTSARKVEAGIILERYSNPVPGSRTESPDTKRRDNSLINIPTQSLKQLLIHYLALFIDSELDYHVSFSAAGQLPARDSGWGKTDGEAGPDLVTFRGT